MKPAQSAAAHVASRFQQAMQLFRHNQLDGALHACQEIIRAQPAHGDALHLLGIIRIRQGDPRSGAQHIRQSLKSNPHQPHVLCNLGNVCMELGTPDEALNSYQAALALSPQFAGAWYGAGNALHGLARYAEAITSFDRALALQPDYAEALLNRGHALLALGQPGPALECFQRVLALDPRSRLALGNCGVALRQLDRLEEALALYDRLSALTPADAEPLLERGLLLLQLQRHEEAVESLSEALRLGPDSATARCGRAAALHRSGRHAEALADCDAALSLAPGRSDALCERALALMALGDPVQALESFDAALAANPALVPALEGRADALRALGEHAPALAAYDDALRYTPHVPPLQYRRALTLRALKRHDEAARAFQAVLDLEPSWDFALGNLLFERLQGCDWTDFPATRALIEERVDAGARACLPGAFQVFCDSPALQQSCARSYTSGLRIGPAPPPPGPYKHDKIVLAYVSADFREHPVAHLATGVFEAHDRQRFTTIAVSLRPPEDSIMGRRVQAAFDHFLDLSGLDDAAIAARLRALEVDIAVDLMGHSGGSRPEIFLHRAAPVQVNFLGYPGTLGSFCHDFMVADDVIVPAGSEGWYDERIVRLPNCFQPNDSLRRRADRLPTRAECNLPENGFVFCCFNGLYKILPDVFDAWLRLLRQVPDSVLWLAEGNAGAVANLRQSASGRGVSPQRLIFAPRVASMEEHLARYSLADVFLDTFPFNAHTTASDALWAGVPLVTLQGHSIASRVAASLLTCLDCPELITQSLEDYVTLAHRLATDPDLLGSFRERLQTARGTSPLFDTAGYCRNLEAAYIAMLAR
jgi:protein O-GlcNAc transferase